jgi:WD40 repeat protein
MTTPLMVIESNGWICSVAFSKDGTQIVSGSSDKSVRVWDASTGAALQQLNGHTDWVRTVAFSHDGIHIVSGSDDRSVQVWDASTGVTLQQLNGHTGPVNSVAFSHDDIHIRGVQSCPTRPSTCLQLRFNSSLNRTPDF